MELIQKKLFSKRIFVIKGNELDVSIESPKGNSRYSLPFEEVGTRKFYKSASKTFPYIFISIVTFMLIILLYSYLFIKDSMNDGTFWVNITLWSFINIGIFLSTKQKSIYLVGTPRSVEFFEDLPNKEEVEKFLDILISKVKDYLKEKYGKIDLDIPEDMLMRNFLFLRNSELITEKEYEELKEDYKQKKIM
jgi:hypothetical protein